MPESAKAAPAAAAFKLELSGLEGALKDNVEAQLAAVNVDGITVQGRFRARVRTAVREGLRALGYYSPSLKFKWGDKPKDEKTPRVLALQVDPGEPVRIAGVTVDIKGDAAELRAFKALLKEVPQKGDILNHGVYEAFKVKLNNLAMALGYFDGKYALSQLQVNPDKHEGYWKLVYESGPRYRFGAVTFHGSQIEDGYLQSLVPFKPGDPFLAHDLAELNERLTQTGWFNSAVVAPDFRGTDENHIIPMYGAVTPRVGNSVEVGLGFSTDVGPRFRGSWSKPWVNSLGHALEANATVSGKEQELDFAYTIPREANPLEEFYQFNGGYKHTDLNDTKSDAMTLAAARHWELETGWQRTVSLRWMLDSFTQGAVDETTMLIYPGVSFSRTRSRGGMMPRWGDSQRYSVDVSSTWWGSDIDFIVFNAQGAIIRTLGEKHRFVGRGSFGWIQTNDFDKVPPDLRFFAGGDRSIRGYDYKSISPKDKSGELRGAERLLTGSIEYQYNVTGKWWGAVFVDAGEAVEKLSDTNFKVGAGFGVRWESPVGPVRLDIARPVGDSEASGIAFYIGLGSEL